MNIPNIQMDWWLLPGISQKVSTNKAGDAGDSGPIP